MITLFNLSLGHPSLTKAKSWLHAAVLGGGLLALVLAPAPSAHAQKYSDWSAPVNLGPVINSGFGDGHTAVSKNGLSLYFGSDRPGGFSLPDEDQGDIYVSQRASVDKPWGPPVNLGPTINSAFGDGRPALSRDEHFMFFQSNRPGAGGADIWVSWRENTLNDFGWQPPVILGAGVNSDSNEAGPSYFENEGGAPQLYFTSSRLGTPDIYFSVLMADGSFGPAQLVPELSSPAVDVQPSIRQDGLEIFFHSARPGSLGLDLWGATRASTLDPWSTPVNVGPAINTRYDERWPFLSSDGETLYFTSSRPGGFGDGALNLYMSKRTITPAQLPPLVTTIRASQVEVCWNSTSNLTYQVQYSSDLTTNFWTSLVECVRSTGSKSCISDPVVVGQPQRFYRVVQTNCVPAL